MIKSVKSFETLAIYPEHNALERKTWKVTKKNFIAKEKRLLRIDCVPVAAQCKYATIKNTKKNSFSLFTPKYFISSRAFVPF